MIWPFKKNSEHLPEKLYFKSGLAFFEYQCRFGCTKIEVNQGLVALVLDAQKEFGRTNPVYVGFNGAQLAALRVVSEDRGFTVFANTPSGKGEKLNPGDVVIWVPSVYNLEFSEELGDPRAGWVGLIRALVKPEINLTGAGFEISCMYD